MILFEILFFLCNIQITQESSYGDTKAGLFSDNENVILNQELKENRFQKPTGNKSGSSFVIQCPSLDKMLQVDHLFVLFFSKEKRFSIFRF